MSLEDRNAVRPGKSFTLSLKAPHHPTKVYTNGDKIQGHVQQLPRTRLHSLTIRFRGEAQSAVRVRNGNYHTTHTAKAILFDTSTELTLPRISNAQSHGWDFQFEFPWETMPVCQTSQFGFHRSFEHRPGHPLPPSSEACLDGNQRILYYIEAFGRDDDALISKASQERIHLIFEPCRTVDSPSYNIFSTFATCVRMSDRLDPRLADRNLGERTRRFFSTNETQPMASFSIKSTVPYQGVSGYPFPIELQLQHETASTCSESPVVDLLNIHAHVTAVTKARVPYKTFDDRSGTHHSYSESHSLRKDLFSKSVRIPMNGNMHLGNVMTGLALPAGLPSSFRTYNLSRWYDLTVTATVQCAGKSYDLCLSRKGGASSFTVLPRLYHIRPSVEHSRVPESDLVSLDRTPIRRVSTDQQTLPPYEEAPPQYEDIDRDVLIGD